MSRKVLPVQKRILPHQVVRGYIRKGLKTLFGGWRRVYPTEVCGCAMTAMFLPKKDLKNEDVSTYSVCRKAAQKYGVTDTYFDWFIAGFDGNAGYSSAANHEEKQGYADGAATRKLVYQKRSAGVLA